ncbi:MAG: hypothetical protein JWN07_747 [Hyphomicrobiales bacterium]|nr:hypothetical protein [Hyphomicrobiales bacterium]
MTAARTYDNQKSSSTMKNIMLAVTFCASTLLGAGALQAQTAASPAKPAPAAGMSLPSEMAKVETWSKKKWAAAQKTWAKDKAKWRSCRDQSAGKHLSGRKSWSFLYDCMNTPV